MRSLEQFRQTVPALMRYATAIITMLLLFLLSGCGGGGGDSSSSVGAAVPTQQQAAEPVRNSYLLTEDTYGLQNATYLSATLVSDGTVTLRTAIANSMTDPNFLTVFRIDILPSVTVNTGVNYSLKRGETSTFPGQLYFFNGHSSTLLKTVDGTINFSAFARSNGSTISGSFEALVEDDNFATTPVSTYSIKSNFIYRLDSYGPVLPTPSPVPATATVTYNSKCAECHEPSTVTANKLAPDLALKGGVLNGKFQPNTAGHNSIQLSTTELHDLQILLNAR